MTEKKDEEAGECVFSQIGYIRQPIDLLLIVSPPCRRMPRNYWYLRGREERMEKRVNGKSAPA